MAVPTRTRCARAANHASATIASGDGLGDATWPPTQSDSIGNDSRYSTSLSAPPDITPNDNRSDVGTMRVDPIPAAMRNFRRSSRPMTDDAPRDYSLFGDEHIAKYEETDGEVGYLWNGAPVPRAAHHGPHDR